MKITLNRAEKFLYELDRLPTQAEKEAHYRAYLAEMKAEKITVPSALDGGENFEAFVDFIRTLVQQTRAAQRAAIPKTYR